MGVGALLGPQAVPCALLELYGCKQSRKRPLEEGNTGVLKMYMSVTAHTALTQADACIEHDFCLHFCSIPLSAVLELFCG